MLVGARLLRRLEGLCGLELRVILYMHILGPEQFAFIEFVDRLSYLNRPPRDPDVVTN